VNISLLDSRAGTPPTAGELLRRHSYAHGQDALRVLLKEWELWCAELMESHLSYPVLAYFRSQHENQSWIASLTAILDTCALVIVGVEGACEKQAELTFAIARHAVVDLSQVFGTAPKPLPHDRLPAQDLRHIRDILAQHGMKVHDGEDADRRLIEFRKMWKCSPKAWFWKNSKPRRAVLPHNKVFLNACSLLSRPKTAVFVFLQFLANVLIARKLNYLNHFVF